MGSESEAQLLVLAVEITVASYFGPVHYLHFVDFAPNETSTLPRESQYTHQRRVSRVACSF